MRRDVPDAALTVLGHTDAVGSDDYNIDLSRRRAAAVMAMLIARGLDPGELSTVAIGKAQPIAPNSTAMGRARNRRVEFMISGSEQANLAVVANREVDGAFFRLAAARPAEVPVSTNVQILKPSRRPILPGDSVSLAPTGLLQLRMPAPDSGEELRQAEPVALHPVAAAPVARTASPSPKPVTRPAEPMPALRPPSDSASY
jgi:hypothetical protein